MEAHEHAARNDARACGVVLARAEQTSDRAAREDDPAWLAYFDAAYLAARMAQCFRDLGEAGRAARYARRSLDMARRHVRGRAFNLSLLATAYAAQGEPLQASAAGRQALDLTVRLTSARSIRYVRARCHQVFFDQSKNNSRTWFDTVACANALNLRAYRERRKAARFSDLSERDPG
jgi:hypothetical protein